MRNLADWLGEAKEAGAWVYGAAADAEVAYSEPDYEGRVVVVLGSEGRGLRPRVAGACDQLVALPRRGRVELAQRLHRGGRAGVRDLAIARRDLTGLHNPLILAP